MHITKAYQRSGPHHLVSGTSSIIQRCSKAPPVTRELFLCFRGVPSIFVSHMAGDGPEADWRCDILPLETWERLFPFQCQGVRRGVALGGRCLLADEMGLGKTVQAWGRL